MLFASSALLFYFIATALGGRLEINCTAPRAPPNGHVLMYPEEGVVKYGCYPGYVLVGRQRAACVAGKWEEPLPVCQKMGVDSLVEPAIPDGSKRPLFNWGSDGYLETKENATAHEEIPPMNDQSGLRMVIYPRRRIVNTVIRPAIIRTGTELEGEEKKRSQTDDKKSTTTVRLEGPPAVNFPRAAVAQNDKGYQTEENLRYMYWMAHHYYPRHASLMQYHTGSPVALSDSQIAWINSLHPELRDQYLRDLYVVGPDGTSEGERARAFLRRYDYDLLYNPVHYLREPVALLSEDPVVAYDYSCNQAHASFVKAPRLPNMHIARYDRRQNPNAPYNHYLTAVYRCNPGFAMLDARHTDLHCSKRRWIGVQPICVPRG